jgi:hypothetical protein
LGQDEKKPIEVEMLGTNYETLNIFLVSCFLCVHACVLVCVCVYFSDFETKNKTNKTQQNKIVHVRDFLEVDPVNLSVTLDFTGKKRNKQTNKYKINK